MSTADLVAIAGFAAMFLMMLVRVPIGIAMGMVGVGGFAAIAGWGPALNLLATSPVRTATDYNFSLIPMFVLMGVFATASGMSKELFRAGHAWLGQFRGGLALATIGACGAFAAICGSSVATAATMTNIALPEMRRFGYPDDLATGVIAAGGTLGILIPPSVVLAIYGFMTEQDVGRLFIAGIVPGLLAIVMYMATVRLAYGRALPAGEPVAWPERLASLRGTWAALLLFIAIIGGIYLGIVTPTEAAAAGAFLTGLIGVVRRRLGGAAIMACLVEALRTTVAIFTILIGALLFGYFLAITQTPQKITSFLVALDLGSYGTLALILALFVLMGCVLDAFRCPMKTTDAILARISPDTRGMARRGLVERGHRSTRTTSGGDRTPSGGARSNCSAGTAGRGSGEASSPASHPPPARWAGSPTIETSSSWRAGRRRR